MLLEIPLPFSHSHCRTLSLIHTHTPNADTFIMLFHTKMAFWIRIICRAAFIGVRKQWICYSEKKRFIFYVSCARHCCRYCFWLKINYHVITLRAQHTLYLCYSHKICIEYQMSAAIDGDDGGGGGYDGVILPCIRLYIIKFSWRAPILISLWPTKPPELTALWDSIAMTMFGFSAHWKPRKYANRRVIK